MLVVLEYTIGTVGVSLAPWKASIDQFIVTPGLSGYNGSGVESYEVRFRVKFLQEPFCLFTRNNLRFVVRVLVLYRVVGGFFVGRVPRLAYNPRARVT